MSRIRPTIPIALLLLVLAPGLTALWADGEADPRPSPSASKGPKVPAFTPEREAAALTFVRRHHPELAVLLDRLRPMNPEQYEQAIGELFQVSESLAALKARDERRHDLALAAWVAKSRVQVLTARLSSASGPDSGLEDELRAALADQFEVEFEQRRLDVEQAEARLRRAREILGRLEGQRDKTVESRFQGLLKRSQRGRRQGEGAERPTPAPPARSLGGETT